VKVIKISCMFCVLLLFLSSFADEITLQNGVDGYNGCEDSYIGTNDWGTISSMAPGSNFGSQSELKVHRESC